MGLCCFGSSDRVEPGPPQSGRRRGSDDFHGVVDERSCTDIVFLAIFLAFLGGLGYGLYYAVERGDINRMVFGFDIDGDICGRPNRPHPNITTSGKDTTRQTFLDIESFNLNNLDPVIMGRCVNSCPTNRSPPILNRCLEIHATSTEATNWFLSSTGLAKFFNQFALDFELCWREVVYLCLISLGLSLVLTVLFRFLAGAMIWLLLIALVLGSLGGTGYLWWLWHGMRGTSGENSMMAYAILMSIVSVLILLIVLVMRKRVELVAALFREAGKSVHAMPLLLIQPIWTLLALCILCAAWAYAALWIESAGYPTRTEAGTVFFRKDTFLQVIRWYNIFAALWISQLCLACQNLIIAGAVADWFFTRDKSRLGCPVARSVGYAVRYHLGSLAFGSLLIALMKLVRMLFNYLERKLRNANTTCFGLVTCLTCFCKCCLYCFEKFLQGLCSNAYIEIAIYGENFCWSAGRAFKMLSNNALRVIAINSVGDFILFLGKAGVVTAVVFIGIELIKDKPGVVYIWTPILIAAIFAYLIAHCFISVFEMCIDTVFICFCEDCEINNGQDQPYFMSRGLMEFVEKSKKALRARAGRDRARQQQPKGAYDNPVMDSVNDHGPWNTGVPPPPYEFHPTAPPLSSRR
ncbi:choline transporter-like protein 1 isoform X1 [Daphnia magna]|uniref:choline transporter-like protein 1 isoform X1 n=1 Tax=Daphnia magna TaxID=35525 RepID=UPI001E1BBCDC|nr:choline transporter-like protein 1 isoform X1 [Daphnia magna]XP_032779771.2 choline transporter-like protein 1 isoform X1 [Daphnia magna]XP_032779772.2 choline transporter-like protein 1 isoform X1 [Daphnia magna]XP_045026826.1 choline transporter-like protein 1 isoform X1 [Daphnia magna]